MPDLQFRDDIDYADLGDSVEVELKLVGGWLYVETPIERKTINVTELRYDGTPRNVLNFVINEHPNEPVLSIHLAEAKLATSRDFRQLAIKAGIKGLVRDCFMPVCERDVIKIVNKVSLRTAEAEALVLSLY